MSFISSVVYLKLVFIEFKLSTHPDILGVNGLQMTLTYESKIILEITQEQEHNTI